MTVGNYIAKYLAEHAPSRPFMHMGNITHPFFSPVRPTWLQFMFMGNIPDTLCVRPTWCQKLQNVMFAEQTNQNLHSGPMWGSLT